MRIEKEFYTKTLYVWNSVSAFFIYAGVTPLHSHNTLQIVVDVRGTFRCRLEHTEWEEHKSVIIKENAVHQLDTNNGVQLILYLDAESQDAVAIRSRYLDKLDMCSPGIEMIDCVAPGELEASLIERDAVLLEKLIRRILNRLVDSKIAPVSDERVTTVIKMLAGDDPEKMTISHLADRIALSESRLRALFKEVMGVPLHRYIIWNRIMMALNKIMNGSDVQDAALASGFTDSSHFHKLLLQMFGVSPSQFIKSNSTKSLQLLTQYPMTMESTYFSSGSDSESKVYKL